MAGVEQPSRGKIFWDEQILQERPRMQVGYLPQDPVFSRRRVWQILRLPASDKELRPDQVETLQKIGLWRIISKLPKELNEKVASAELSRGERRAFALGAIVLGDDTLWLLDDPLEGLAEEKARDRLEEILARATGRTLVTAFSRPVALERFDRVLTLRRGRISFDSTPAQWEETECRR